MLVTLASVAIQFQLFFALMGDNSELASSKVDAIVQSVLKLDETIELLGPLSPLLGRSYIVFLGLLLHVVKAP